MISGTLTYQSEETDAVSVAGALYTIDTEDSFDVDGTSYEIASTTLEVDDGTDAREFLFFF